MNPSYKLWIHFIFFYLRLRYLIFNALLILVLLLFNNDDKGINILTLLRQIPALNLQINDVSLLIQSFETHFDTLHVILLHIHGDPPSLSIILIIFFRSLAAWTTLTVFPTTRTACATWSLTTQVTHIFLILLKTIIKVKSMNILNNIFFMNYLSQIS